MVPQFAHLHEIASLCVVRIGAHQAAYEVATHSTRRSELPIRDGPQQDLSRADRVQRPTKSVRLLALALTKGSSKSKDVKRPL